MVIKLAFQIPRNQVDPSKYLIPASGVMQRTDLPTVQSHHKRDTCSGTKITTQVETNLVVNVEYPILYLLVDFFSCVDEGL